MYFFCDEFPFTGTAKSYRYSQDVQPSNCVLMFFPAPNWLYKGHISYSVNVKSKMINF